MEQSTQIEDNASSETWGTNWDHRREWDNIL